jgi:plastocyanin
MTLRFRITAVIFVALAATTVAIACSGETTASIVQTQTAENRIQNTQVAREATIAAGGDPDAAGGIDVGSDSAAARARQSFAATQTAIASGIGDTPTPTPTPAELVAPDGPALTNADSPTVDMQPNAFVPAIIKVKVGTTVTWTNGRRSASSVKSLEGQAEVFDSGAISKGTFDKDPAKFEYTFTIPGCHEYGSFFSGETNRGAVCVEE